jgi:hypothetical protein
MSIIKINEMCYCTFPCMHDVEYRGIKKCMRAAEIYKILFSNNEEIPEHFKYVKEIVDLEYLKEELRSGKLFQKIVDNYLFKTHKNKIFNMAIQFNRRDIIDYIFNSGFTLTNEHFILCAKIEDINFSLFKFFVSKLKTTTILSSVIPHAVYHNKFKLIKYMLDDIHVPYTNSFFNLKNIENDTPLREYLIEKSVSHNVRIVVPYKIGLLKKTKLYDRFVILGLVSQLPHTNITWSLFYDDIKITHNDDLTDHTTDDLDMKRTDLHMETYNIFNNIQDVCNINFNNLKTFKIYIPHFRLSLKSMAIKLNFSNICTIKNCILTGNNDKHIYSLDVCNNIVSLKFLESLSLEFLLYTQFSLDFEFISPPVVDTYITSVDYTLTFTDTINKPIDGFIQLSKTIKAQCHDGYIMIRTENQHTIPI